MNAAITTKVVELDKIVSTNGTQIRARLDTETVDRYAIAMQAEEKLPHPVCYFDGSEYILADGFHRVMAARRNGNTTMRVEVHPGGKADALRYALSANTAHGLPLTNADKRRSVDLALHEWPKLSDRELAKICAVSDKTVSDVRRDNCGTSAVESPRIGADGKTRKLPAKRKKIRTAEQAAPPASSVLVNPPEQSEESIQLWWLREAWTEASEGDRATFIAWIKQRGELKVEAS